MPARSWASSQGEDWDKAWIEGHPLAEGSSNIIAMMIRKLGGYSFQEINANLEQLKRFTTWGPDLSYDFVTRPPYLYAMATGNAEPLRLMVRLMQKQRLDPGIFVHALQNHDELMFDLSHLRTHARKEFQLGDRTVLGKDLYQGMYDEAKQQLGDSGVAYMPEFSNLGFCGTIASYSAACCGISDPYHMSAEQKGESSSSICWPPSSTPCSRGCSHSPGGTSWAPFRCPQTKCSPGSKTTIFAG